MRYYVAFAAIWIASSAYSYEIPDHIRKKYQYLLADAPAIQPDGSVRLGSARLFMREGIRVLHLKGDRFEMAFQHGRLLRDIIPIGALPQIAAMIENTARNSFPQIPSVVDPIINGIYTKYSRSLLNHAAKNTGVSLDEYMVEAFGLAMGSNYDLDKIVYAFLTPEILQVILGQQMRGAKNLPPPTTVNECTDFAVLPTSTESGGYIIGRNTDYSLNGYFDKFPTVIYYEPSDGAQPYMTVTSAGVHSAGVVGYNASGIFLGVHTIPTWDTSGRGHPVFDVGQYVLRNAKNFDHAVDIFKSMLPGAGWVYTLVSTKEGRSAAVELSNGKISVRETSGQTHIQSNHYMTPAMQSRNLDLNAAINEDTRARYQRVQNLIESTSAPFDTSRAIEILADKTDPFSHEVRGLGNVVATHYTVTSAVIDTGHKHIFVASGLAPVSLSKFIELPLIETFDPETFAESDYRTIEKSDYHREFPSISQAEQLYILAKQAFEINLNPARSHQILIDVVKTDPTNPAYRLILGLMSIKARNYPAAIEALDQCTRVQSNHHQLACRYYIGRIKADTGNDAEAISQMEWIIEHADPALEGSLVRAASKALKQLRRTHRLPLNSDTLSVFMPEGDVLAY